MPIFRNLAFAGGENLAKVLDTRLLMIILTFSWTSYPVYY